MTTYRRGRAADGTRTRQAVDDDVTAPELDVQAGGVEQLRKLLAIQQNEGRLDDAARTKVALDHRLRLLDEVSASEAERASDTAKVDDAKRAAAEDLSRRSRRNQKLAAEQRSAETRSRVDKAFAGLTPSQQGSPAVTLLVERLGLSENAVRGHLQKLGHKRKRS